MSAPDAKRIGVGASNLSPSATACSPMPTNMALKRWEGTLDESIPESIRQPSLLTKQLPGKLNMLLLEHPFSVIPVINFGYDVGGINYFFTLGNPVNGCQQFQTKRRFKSVNQLCHLIKASL